LKSTVLRLGLGPKRAENIVHCLFGGTKTTSNHYCYDIHVVSEQNNFNFEVLDQPYICDEVSPVFYGPWMQELHNLNVDLSDLKSGPIEILLGADVAHLLYTGRRHVLRGGLVAIETYVGSTVMGKVSTAATSNAYMCATSLFVNQSITQL